MLSLFVLLGKRDRTSIIYSIFVIFASFWALGLAFFILEKDINTALHIANFYYVSALGIPAFFLYFSYIFLNKEFKVSRIINYLVYLSVISIAILFIFNKNLLLEEIILKDWGKDVFINKFNYYIYAVYFIFFVGLSYYNLIKSYLVKIKAEEKIQLKLVIWGTSIGFLFGMIFDLFLPFMGDYRHIFVGPVFSLFMVGSIAYAITKYRMFDIKVVVTETFVILLWVFMLIRTIISTTTQEQVINSLAFLVTLIVGIFIIKSVRKEVQLREKIENLAKDLEVANKDLEKANDRLKEVDQLKSEFLSLATHQIRAPLTAIKGYASLILEGDYGKLTPDARGAVQVIFNSCQNLVVIVSEFLDISRIEQGRMKYDLVKFDVSKLISEIISELKPTIEKTGLTMNFESQNIPFMVYADLGKLKQVLGNIIDNSMKYTPKGGIRITIEEEVNKTKILVSDTGIGVAPEDISKLFTKFTRAKDAFRTNVIGTGLGLYVAKQMIEAQNGKVWVESPGLGKGSTFCIELPKE